jgi:lipoprotein-anchoring transpeptidase ErfK/SrfK
MKIFLRSVLGAVAILAAGVTSSAANDRYADRPPVMVSPDLSAPWVLQLGRAPGIVRQSRQVIQQPRVRYAQPAQPDRVRTASVQAPAKRMVMRPQINPLYLPQEVAYDGPQKPGTIVIDTTQNFLFLVENNGKARRYGVGTGKPGFEWSGTHKITNKRVWPDWRPPAR